MDEASSTHEDIHEILRRLNLVSTSDLVQIDPLTGGISSEILRVRTRGRDFVIKRALPKLRVQAEWRAPIERNDHEYAWLETVASLMPEVVPQLLGRDAVSHSFAMEYLDPRYFKTWKSRLLEGHVDIHFAADVGCRLGTIHARTADNRKLARLFSTDRFFHLLRIEPYFEAVALRHPAASDRLLRLSSSILATKRVLVHGDVSPKNILVGLHGPVFLDAECAWYGDPAFDLAFCLNHLLLKCLWNRQAACRFLRAFDALLDTYMQFVNWESKDAFEARVGAILPALFLSRVDGKSPVEYITAEEDRELVRSTALPFIFSPPESARILRNNWAASLRLTGKS